MKNICRIHDDIMEKSSEIMSLDKYINKEDCEDLLGRLEEALSLASDIYNLAHEAKGCGQRMEDRLSEYKSSIEDLGFIRKKNT